MTEFFDIIFSLPTAVFTWPLMLVVLYWGLSAAGLGGLDGGLDSLDGAVDGAVDGAIDGAVDGAAEALDGALDGVAAKIEGVSAKVEGGLAKVEAALPDGAIDVVPAGAEKMMPGPWHAFGMGDVPRTFSGSLIIIFGWTFSVLGSYFVPGYEQLATRGLWLALLLAAASFLLAMASTAVAIQPIRRAMEAGQGPSRQDLLGQICTVTTQRVDDSFGQAELDDGSSLIQVRSREQTGLTRGSRAVIFDYDAQREIFWVAPVELEP